MAVSYKRWQPAPSEDEWEDVSEDEWEDVTPAVTAPEPRERPKYGEATLSDLVTGNLPVEGEEPGFLESLAGYIPEPIRAGYEWASTAPEFLAEPSRRYAQQLSEYIDPSRTSEWTPRSLTSAYIESLGNIIPGLASPLNVATGGALGGAGLAARAGMPTVARGLAATGRGLSYPVAGTGLYHTATAESPAEAALGLLETAGGVVGTRAKTPSVKPGIARSTDEILAANRAKIEAMKAGLPETIPETVAPEFVPVGEEPPYVPPVRKSPEQLSYELAQEKFNMGRELPEGQIPGVAPISTENKAFLDRLPDNALDDFISRQSKNPNYDTPTGRSMLDYARQLMDERLRNPEVPIASELPKPTEATNISVADRANIEAWYRFKKIYDSGKMTEPQMLQWAELHNQVKNLKPSGAVTIQPYRFETPPPEPPAFTAYELPDGTRVNLDTSATKGAKTTTFQTKGGEIVTATRVDEAIPEGQIDLTQPLPPRHQAALARIEAEMPPEFRESTVPPAQAVAREMPQRPIAEQLQASLESAAEPRLSRDLAGATPRFNMGGDSYIPMFDSDIDKALFIIAQKTPSVRNADYMKFVTNSLRISEDEAVSLARKLKETLKVELQGAEPGQVRIAKLHDAISRVREEAPLADRLAKATETPPVVAKTQAAGGGKPPGKPPKKISADEPRKPKDAPITPEEAEAALAAGDIPEGKASKLREIYELSRGLMSVDAPFGTSAAFRQAAPLIGTRNWFKAWGKSVQAFGSQRVFDDAMAKLNNHPLVKGAVSRDAKGNVVVKPGVAERIGLKLTELRRFSRREEVIRSRLAEKIPAYGVYVKASNRAYTMFLNQLRVDQLDTLSSAAKVMGKNIETDLVFGKKLADLINDTTGRGPLRGTIGGKEFSLEQNAKILGDVLWSPHLIASRMRLLYPEEYLRADPFIRWEYAKSMTRLVSGWGSMLGLGWMAGAEVGLDPNSADFGKAKFGNTRIDPGAGFQQFMVFTFRVAPQMLGGGGVTSSTTGKFTPFGASPMAPTRPSLAGQFALSKVHPTLDLIRDLASGTKREPVHVADRVLQAYFPMFVTGMMEIAQDDPDLLKTLLGGIGAGMSGLGSQTYERGGFNEPKITPGIDKLLEGIGLPRKSVTGLDITIP
jgi:hypothetical protein